MTGTLEEVGKQDLVKTTVDIGGDIVDVITHGMLANLGKELLHVVTVTGGYLGRDSLDAPIGLHIDEPMRLITVLKVEFQRSMVSMEKKHFVFAVAQMAESVEERFTLVGADKGVGEDDHEGTSVKLFCHQVERVGNGGRTLWKRTLVDRSQLLLKEGVKITLVRGAGADLGL